MLLVLIGGASNEYPQHMYSWRNKDISIFRMKKAPYLLLRVFGDNSEIFFSYFSTENCDTLLMCIYVLLWRIVKNSLRIVIRYS